jgi:hypothetical protein
MMASLLSWYVEDQDIREVLEFASQLSHSHLQQLMKFFSEAVYPLPVGFSKKEDVYLDEPPLFSETFMLNYMYVIETLFALLLF